MKTKAPFKSVLLVIFLALACGAKEEPKQVLQWPESGKPLLRFTFTKFKSDAGSKSLRYYVSQTTVENLWQKKISGSFNLYLFDKDKVRIGEGVVSFANVAPGETVRFQIGVEAAGTPATITLSPQSLPAELMPEKPVKTISLTVNTIPQGANFKLDSVDAGVTPKVIRVTPGKHVLEFSKEGFTPGSFPLDIGADDANGGVVSYELGTSAHDTLELRDGSIMVCDLESMSATEVVVRVAGNLQHLDRNKVKRILLTERDMPAK
jgi:PEGA domain